MFTDLIDRLDMEQLNEIPHGFRNNIIWNYGHIVVSTQGLCYVRTKVIQDRSSIQFIDRYQKGSVPQGPSAEQEVEVLKELSLSTIDKLEEDYKSGVFNNITPFSTDTYGFEMKTIEEVILCSLAHDNLHLGYAMAQKKNLKQ